MMIRRVNKILFMLLALSLAGLAAPEVFGQPCLGCVAQANPKNRNPERREDRPNLPPETDSRDSDVRPPEMPAVTDPPASPASAPRRVITPDGTPPDPRNSSR